MKHRQAYYVFLAAAAIAAHGAARADIFRWDNNQPIPGTSGMTAGANRTVGSSDTSHPLDLSYANFSAFDFSGGYLESAIVTNARFNNANIAAASFSRIQGLVPSQIYSTSSYAAHNLHDIKFFLTDLKSANLSFLDLTKAHFSYGNFSNSSFRQSTLTKAIFVKADVTGVDFTDAKIAGVFFLETTLSKNQLTSTADYKSKDLTGIVLWAQAFQGIDLSAQNLTKTDFDQTDFTGANLRGANLAQANLSSVKLSNADLTNATLKGANLSGVTGLTAAQISSTADYQGKALSGITFVNVNMTTWDLSNQNLSGSSFGGCDFRGANLLNASIGGASLDQAIVTPAELYQTSNYASRDMSGINLSHINLLDMSFANCNLRNSRFQDSNLLGTDFSNAIIDGAFFLDSNSYLLTAPPVGLSKEQLYSTASYKLRDLHGISLINYDIRGWDFSRQSLKSANLYNAILTDTRFVDADVRGVNFLYVPSFNRTDYTRADLRRAAFLFGFPSQAIAINAIRTDGTIEGLALASGERLRIRNDSMPISVKTSATLATGAGLDFELQAAWTSTITFESGVSPSLGGTLNLELDPSTDPLSLVGKTLRLFNWNGATGDGIQFGAITGDPRVMWDTSKLYTDGTIFGVSAIAAVPEPASILLACCGSLLLLRRRSRPS